MIGEQGKDPRQTPGQHRLASTRWAMQQQMMPACGCDLDRSTCQSLTFDIRQVGPISRPGGWTRVHGISLTKTESQQLHCLGQRSDTVNSRTRNSGCVGL
jgi:hypothetical protein